MFLKDFRPDWKGYIVKRYKFDFYGVSLLLCGDQNRFSFSTMGKRESVQTVENGSFF